MESIVFDDDSEEYLLAEPADAAKGCWRNGENVEKEK